MSDLQRNNLQQVLESSNSEFTVSRLLCSKQETFINALGSHLKNWCEENRRVANAPCLTRTRISNEIYSLYGRRIGPKVVSAYVRETLGWEWRKRKNGYYHNKRREKFVISHREKYSHTFEYYASRPDLYALFVHDESTMRVNMYQSHHFCRTDHPEDQYDENGSTGPGQFPIFHHHNFQIVFFPSIFV